jgi:hypothetical protein
MKDILMSASNELYDAFEYETDSHKLRSVYQMAGIILTEFFRDEID